MQLLILIYISEFMYGSVDAICCYSLLRLQFSIVSTLHFVWHVRIILLHWHLDVCCRKDSKPPVPVTVQSVPPMMAPTAPGYPGYQPGSVTQHGYMPTQQSLLVGSQFSAYYFFLVFVKMLSGAVDWWCVCLASQKCSILTLQAFSFTILDINTCMVQYLLELWAVLARFLP